MKYQGQDRRITTHPRRKARLERTLARKETELELDVFENEDKEKLRKRQIEREIEALKERICHGR